MVDYHVDRREVQVQRCTEPTRTNSPITFGSSFRSSLSRHTGPFGGSGNTSGGDAAGPHLFPFRTEKLSPHAPMVLPGRVGEQAAAAFGGRRRTGVWLLPAAAAPSFLRALSLPLPLPISRPSFLPSSPPPLPRPWPPYCPPLRPGSGLRASPSRVSLRDRRCGRGNRKRMHVSHQRAF